MILPQSSTILQAGLDRCRCSATEPPDPRPFHTQIAPTPIVAPSVPDASQLLRRPAAAHSPRCTSARRSFHHADGLGVGRRGRRGRARRRGGDEELLNAVDVSEAQHCYHCTALVHL
eukprot:3938189-Rhodomonas_salina.2